MSVNDRTSQLGNELQDAIESVKSALSLAATQKNMFHEQAVVAKHQIQDDISFHLELLRNREVWLLEQVDVHAQIKDETFENHLNELCVLLAKLEVYEELLETQELQGNEVIAGQAKEIMSQLSNLPRHFEDESGVCFSADNFALTDAVKKYGSIVGESGESNLKTVNVSKKKSASIDGSNKIVFIQEHFKQVANSPVNDWLLDGLEVKESRIDSEIVWKNFQELRRSDCKEWLYSEPQPMDLETVSNRFQEHFQQVKSAPATEWLQTGVVIDEDSSAYRSHATLDTSENIKAWLLTSSESLSSRCEDFNDEGISLCRQSSVDIEDSENSQAKPIVDELPNDWLMKSSTSRSPQVTQPESWLQRFQEASGTTTSDWLIKSDSAPSEAYRDCYDWLTQESIDRCKDCPGDCYKDTFKVFKNVLNSSKSEWLATVSDW